jgi:hypothetical protein
MVGHSSRAYGLHCVHTFTFIILLYWVSRIKQRQVTDADYIRLIISSSIVMVQNLNPNEIYQFIVSDFRGAWDSIADNYNQSIGRDAWLAACLILLWIGND